MGVKLPQLVNGKKSTKAETYRQPSKSGETNTGGLNQDVSSKCMVDVVTHLNALEIKRLTDRYTFEFSNSIKLSKTEITKAESKKKANRGMDDTMANRLKETFMVDQQAATAFIKANILGKGLKTEFNFSGVPKAKKEDLRTPAEKKYDEE